MTDPTETTPPAEKASVWEDFIDIFYAPSAVFERRRAGRFALALLVLTVLLAILYWLSLTYLAPMYDAEFARGAEIAMRKNPQITMEQMQQARGFQQTFGVFIGLVVVPITVFLTGFVLWLVGKLFDSTQPLAAAFMVATYAQFPRIIDWALRNVQGALLDRDQVAEKYGVTLSVARFLDRSAVSPVLYELAGRLDVFTIWVTILLGLGLHITGNVPKRQAWIAAGLVWLIGALPVVLTALRS